jgi:hypothetical protein
MSDELLREHKLTDALPPQPDPGSAALGAEAGDTHQVDAEQQRQAQEASEARNAQGGVRDRLVEIGKANHMAGRGNGRVSDT